VQAIGDVYGAAERGEPLTLELRVRQRLAAWNSARSALRAVELMYDCAGTTVSEPGNRIDRALRDLRQAAQHIALAQPAQEAAGKALLGLDPGGLV
jgi:hypothetical protein